MVYNIGMSDCIDLTDQNFQPLDIEISKYTMKISMFKTTTKVKRKNMSVDCGELRKTAMSDCIHLTDQNFITYLQTLYLYRSHDLNLVSTDCN